MLHAFWGHFAFLSKERLTCLVLVAHHKRLVLYEIPHFWQVISRWSSLTVLLHSLARVISSINAVSSHCCIYILSSRIKIDSLLLPLFSSTEHRSIDQYQNAVERFVVSAQLTRSKVHPPQSNSWLGELHLGVRSLTRMRALLI